MGRRAGDGDDQRHTHRAAVGLIGRTAELTTLRAVLDERGGSPAFVAIVGEPGIGKTRLLTELLSEARRAGPVVLTGRGAEFEQGVPFGVFRNAIEDHLRGWPEQRWAPLDAADRRLLPGVFPTLAADGAGTGLLAGERYRLHRAVRVLLEQVAVPGGLVLAFDDLHWGDDSSMELLDHLIRHPPRAPVVFAVAYRPRQAPDRLHQAVARAAQQGWGTTVEVGPLSATEAGALVPADLSPTRLTELYRISGGNPFYLQVLARHRPADRPATDVQAGDLLPQPVRAALAGEFARLQPEVRQVLHAAAVAGDEYDPEMLAAITGLPVARVHHALDELTRRDLIRAGQMPGDFRFRHPLLRNAAYHDAGAGWRLGAHARAAAELRTRRAPAEAQAAHVAASAAVGDLAAVRLLHTVAQHAMPATPSAAAHWLGSALRLLPPDPATATLRLRLLNLRGRALGITGRLQESQDILGEILRLVPAGSQERVTAVGFLATLQNLLGNHAGARALLARELAGLPEQHSLAAGTLRVGLLLTSVMYGPFDPAAVAEAIRVARGTGNRPLLAFALSVAVLANQSFDVASPHTTSWLDEAVRYVDAMPDGELAERLDTAMFLGWGELYRERFADAHRHLRRALQIARAGGQGHLIGTLQTVLGVHASMTGQLSSAVVHLDDAMESAVLTSTAQTQARVLGYRCWVAVWQGELDDALAYGKQAVELAALGNSPDWQAGPAELTLGFARYAAGDPAAGLDLMLRGGRPADRVSVRPVWRARWYQWLAAAAAAAGDDRGAAGWAERADRLPSVDGLPRRAGFIQLAQVHATLRRDPAAAAAHAERAARSFARAGDRIGAAQAHVYAAAAYRSLGSAVAAEREIGAARLGFAACDAAPGWLAAMTGVPLFPPGDPIVGATGQRAYAGLRLTDREHSVLELLAESLTAATIARRLGISSSSVHKHLARLYRKLETTDRLAAVLRAREAGLLPDSRTRSDPIDRDLLINGE